MVFVIPSNGMSIRASNHIDLDRRCYHPYLAYWTDDHRRSVLIMAVRSLQDVFSRDPPLYRSPHEPSDMRRNEVVQTVSNTGKPGDNIESLTEPLHRPPRPAKLPQDLTSVSREASDEPCEGAERIPPALPPPPPASFRVQAPPNERVDVLLYSKRRSQPVIAAGYAQKKTETGQRQYTRDSVHNYGQTGHFQSDRDLREVLLSNIYKTIDHHRDNESKFHSFEISTLKQKNDNILQRRENLEEFEGQLQHLKRLTASNSGILSEKLPKAKSVIKASSTIDLKNLDQIVVAQNSVYNQLYELVADEMGLEDTIYALGKAFELERIDLDVFLKVSPAF